MREINLQATIPDEHAGLRLDQSLAQLFPDYSRSRLQGWLKDGHIQMDAKAPRARVKVLGGETVTIHATINEESFHQAESIKLDIIYEDKDLIVINKPVGLVVHPAAGNPDGTLLNALLHHAPELADLPRAGIVHRIDKDTSGLLVIARSVKAHTQLVADLQEHLIEREYLAVANGRFTAGSSIHEPIGRHPRHRTKMAVVHSGKRAVTHYRVAERFRDYTLLSVKLETGRTHQIRVHMAHIQHALLGDQTYGGRLKLPKNANEKLVTTLRTFKRQALHAYKLHLTHPVTGEEMEWMAPIPEDLLRLLAILRAENPLCQ